MEEPSPRSSRFALAAALVAAALVGGAGFLLGRGTIERAPVAVPQGAIVAPTPTPSPTPDEAGGVLTRADLIALAAEAADAAATGRAAPASVLGADGRRFELSVPFGCAGPAAPDSEAPMRWRYDAEKETLRIHVAPVTWTAADWWSGAAPAGVEAIEGFWIARPWIAEAACPPAPRPQPGPTATPDAAGPRPAPSAAPVARSQPVPTAVAGETLAIAQFFATGGARQGRRGGQAFEMVARVAPDALRARQGFRLRLSGRIASVPGGGGPVLCRQPAGPAQRPVCVIAISAGEVRLENPATGETLATWSGDRSDTAE